MDIRDRVKELRRVPAATLEPNPKNWRRHPDRQRSALRGVLAEVGFADALIARETPAGGLELIDGHLRREEMGDALVPVLVVDLSDAEADKLLATLDPLAGMAEADDAALTALLQGMDVEDAEMRKLVSFLATEHAPRVAVEVPTPDPPADPVSRSGDLWLLGEHRLLCGDATDSEDVGRLLDGVVPFICVTDPPYGVSYDPNWRNVEAAKGNLAYAARRVGEVPRSG
jgi:hypothetical protein